MCHVDTKHACMYSVPHRTVRLNPRQKVHRKVQPEDGIDDLHNLCAIRFSSVQRQGNKPIQRQRHHVNTWILYVTRVPCRANRRRGNGNEKGSVCVYTVDKLPELLTLNATVYGISMAQNRRSGTRSMSNFWRT